MDNIINIPGYTGYGVTEDGLIYSKWRTGNGAKYGPIYPYREVKQVGRGGYKRVGLMKNGKQQSCYVHRLVAMAFIENPNNYNQINHIDGDKTNNNVFNLEWCSAAQNIQHAFDNNLKSVACGEHCNLSKLTEKEVYEIRMLYFCGVMQKDIAKDYGITQGTVSGIVNNKSWNRTRQQNQGV